METALIVLAFTVFGLAIVIVWLVVTIVGLTTSADEIDNEVKRLKASGDALKKAVSENQPHP